MVSTEEQERQKKQIPFLQKSPPLTPPTRDITSIEQRVDEKYLELERRNLPPQEPPLTPPASQPATAPLPQEPVLPKKEEKHTPPPASVTAAESATRSQEETDPDEDESEIIFEEVPTEEQKPIQEQPHQEQDEQPVKVKKRLGFGRRARKTKLQRGEYTEDISQALRKQDLKGEAVFSEETGEKLGIITDTVYDENHNIIGYKIKTEEADTLFKYPTEQFMEGKHGVLFTPTWYQNAVETIENLEFIEKVSPELSSLVEDGMFNEELYDLLLKRDDTFGEDVEDAVALKEILVEQIKLLEERRTDLTDKANKLVTQRLIEDVDRRKFSEDVQELRRKVKILDLNIQKCNDLLQRLNNTSIGAIAKFVIDIEENEPEELPEEQPRQPAYQTRRPSYDYHEEQHEAALTELIAELIEEKIVDDIKKQLIRNKIKHHRDTGYKQERRSDPTYDEEGEQRPTKSRNRVKRPRQRL